MSGFHLDFLTNANGTVEAWNGLASSPAFGREYMTWAFEQQGRVVTAWDKGTPIDQAAERERERVARARASLASVPLTYDEWPERTYHEADLALDREAEDAHFTALAAEWEYDDSQRLDELATAEDYNRFEENALASESALDAEAYADEQADLANDERWIGE